MTQSKPWVKTALLAVFLWVGSSCCLAARLNEELGMAEDYLQDALNGDPAAMNNLGRCYAGGRGVPADQQKAVEWYLKAAEAGNPGAMCNLGIRCRTGNALPKDPEKSIEWFTKGCDKGHARSCYQLGVTYHEGLIISRDDKKSMEFLERAADAGSADAMYYLGCLFQNGDGVEKNLKTAFDWFKQAADAGDVQSCINIADIYISGPEQFPVDYKKGCLYLEKAIESGSLIANVKLADLYIIGNENFPVDYEKGRKLLEKAADAGNETAMYKLGLIYMNGFGVAVNHEKAVDYFKKSADAGSPLGMYYLAESIKSGKGGSKDEKAAVNWFIKADSHGVGAASFQLGLRYLDGSAGLPRDATKAFAHFQKAIDYGMSDNLLMDLAKLLCILDETSTAASLLERVNVGNLDAAGKSSFYYVLGCYQAREKLPSAVDNLENSIDLDPGNVDAHQKLLLLLSGTDPIKYRACNKRFLERFPDNRFALNNAILICISDQELEKAKIHAEHVYKLYPTNYNVIYMKGLVEYASQNFDKGLELMAEAYANTGDDFFPAYLLGNLPVLAKSDPSHKGANLYSVVGDDPPEKVKLFLDRVSFHLEKQSNLNKQKKLIQDLNFMLGMMGDSGVVYNPYNNSSSYDDYESPSHSADPASGGGYSQTGSSVYEPVNNFYEPVDLKQDPSYGWSQDTSPGYGFNMNDTHNTTFEPVESHYNNEGVWGSNTNERPTDYSYGESSWFGN